MQYYISGVLTVIAACLIALTFSEFFGSRYVVVRGGEVSVTGRMVVDNVVQVKGEVEVAQPAQAPPTSPKQSKSIILHAPR